jgi:hypothetical protein
MALLALPAGAQTLSHRAENGVPVVLVQVARTAKQTEVALRVEQALPGVCWTASGPDSPYLLADGHRYRFLGGDNIAACPARRDYEAGTVMTLRFEPLGAQVRSFSLVEGQGGENQLIDPASSRTRYWNFLRVRLE